MTWLCQGKTWQSLPYKWQLWIASDCQHMHRKVCDSYLLGAGWRALEITAKRCWRAHLHHWTTLWGPLTACTWRPLRTSAMYNTIYRSIRSMVSEPWTNKTRYACHLYSDHPWRMGQRQKLAETRPSNLECDSSWVFVCGAWSALLVRLKECQEEITKKLRRSYELDESLLVDSHFILTRVSNQRTLNY